MFVKHESSNEEKKQLFYEHKHKYRISMYTDGSKKERGTGAGVVVFSNSEKSDEYTSYKLKLHKQASVFSAELVALEAAINSIKYTKSTSCTIYSDSKSALQAILEYDSKNPIVQNIHILLKVLEENSTHVKFCWVPAHCGILGNEIADKIAKKATRFSKNCKNPILFADIKAFLKKETVKKWQQDWNRKINNKLFSVDSTIGKRNFSGFHTRLEEIKFTRLRLGHTKLTHSFLFTADPQPRCDACFSVLSIKHILIDCPKYEPERCQFFGNYEINLRDILARGDWKKIRDILGFIKFTRLFSKI